MLECLAFVVADDTSQALFQIIALLENDMTYVVTQYCRKCKYTDCVEVCPVDAFHEGEDMLYINPETCIDCNACVEECPVEAIYADIDVPQRWQNWLQINAEECEKYEVITEQKDPLPTAKSLKDLQAEDPDA